MRDAHARERERADEGWFECRFEVRWSDLDGNRHVRNTAFSDYATHARFRLLTVHGFSQAQLEAARFGPVMMREVIRYKREVLFGEELLVTVRRAGLSPDVSQWRVHQDVLRNAIAAVRRQLWAQEFISSSASDPESATISSTLFHRRAQALAYAA